MDERIPRTLLSIGRWRFSSRDFDSTRVLWIIGVDGWMDGWMRACVRSFVRACDTRACYDFDRNGLSVSHSLLRSFFESRGPALHSPLSGVPPLGQTERPRSIYLAYGSSCGKTLKKISPFVSPFFGPRLASFAPSIPSFLPSLRNESGPL